MTRRKGFGIAKLPGVLKEVIGVGIFLIIAAGILTGVQDLAEPGRFEYETVEPGTGSSLDICEEDIVNEDNIRHMSIILDRESGRYDAKMEGTVAVGYTVLNRMATGTETPDGDPTRSVEDVASGYDGWSDYMAARDDPEKDTPQISPEAEQLAEDILKCAVVDKTQGATHFHSPQSMPPAEVENTGKLEEDGCESDGEIEVSECAPDAAITPGNDKFDVAFIEYKGKEPLLGEDLTAEPGKWRHYKPWRFNSYFIGDISSPQQKEVCIEELSSASEEIQEMTGVDENGCISYTAQPFERICVEGVDRWRFKFYKLPGDGSGEKQC